MGGIAKKVWLPAELPVQRVGPTQVIRLRDQDIQFSHNADRSTYLFRDFDRMFDLLVRATGSKRQSYDIFGHSAGGQILQRFALFQPDSKADRIVASNAGWYTLPDLRQTGFTGMGAHGGTLTSLRASLKKRLIVLLGEKDDGDDAGGIMLHTPSVDAQGLGRRTRGESFFRMGRKRAEKLNASFAWRMKIVPQVGHDFRAMSAAAAKILYSVPSEVSPSAAPR